MNLKGRLKKQEYEGLWREYCGFLDLDMDGYMYIQNRLMREQMEIWSGSPLGRSFLGAKKPASIEEFLSAVPLTTYVDYSDALLFKKNELLPEPPVVWLQTTWEGGLHPVKLAPYSKRMLDTFQKNMISALILCCAKKKGEINIRPKDTVLSGFAPLPFFTGLIPPALTEVIDLAFLPPPSAGEKLSFSQRSKLGFKMGLSKGIDYFFSMGSIAYYISKSFKLSSRESSDQDQQKLGLSPRVLVRVIKAILKSKREKRAVLPKDVFRLKGFVCAGTDNACYKDELEQLWGIRPSEIFAGTELSMIGTESWNKDGMYFFPDVCFYEFISESEMQKNLDDPDYRPETVRMNEVVPGEKYELVVSLLKGGAFMRYRIGDVYQCLGLSCKADETEIPRFRYIDRVPDVIDIAGFTRITERSIQSVLLLSGLPIRNWFAAKEYTENNKPFLHMYVEIDPEALSTHAVNKEILREHLKVYFKYFDSDYNDLKRLLGIEPLEISILRCGTFAAFAANKEEPIRTINPALADIRKILALQEAF